MSVYQPIQPFRFLDLPGEIRNSIYHLLLCSWDNLVEHDPNLISKLSRRCPSYQATAFLRTNKQIQAEASDYMVKRNQFVRITCRGFDVRNLFHCDKIPVITTNAHKVPQFKGYLMQVTLTKPTFSPPAVQFNEFEILMLRADLPTLCEHLDIESVMADANSTTREHASITAEIKLNYAYSHSLTPKIQDFLLNPVTTLVRGILNLSMLGPVDPALTKVVISNVALPRWTDTKAILEEIGTGVDVGKRQWQQENYYSAAESWAYAMRTLERMRYSSSWRGLKEAGGEDFVNKTADLYFTLNLFHAQFLQVDMASHHARDHVSSLHTQRNGNLAIQHLRKCETASARFAQHAGATWRPSNQQHAKMLFRHARCLRLMHDFANSVRAVTLIEEAATLAPLEIEIMDEKDAVLAWNADVEEIRRSLEQRQIEADTGTRVSWWSFLRTAIVELAS